VLAGGLRPQTEQVLAERMGWSRPRDLRAKVLDSLVELGLVERRDSAYALSGDQRERAARVRNESYSTVQLRVRRTRSEEGLWVHRVEESGMVASEVERDEIARARHAHEQEGFRLRLAQESPEVDERCRQVLNAWDEEREAAREPDGAISELERIESETEDLPMADLTDAAAALITDVKDPNQFRGFAAVAREQLGEHPEASLPASERAARLLQRLRREDPDCFASLASDVRTIAWSLRGGDGRRKCTLGIQCVLRLRTSGTNLLQSEPLREKAEGLPALKSFLGERAGGGGDRGGDRGGKLDLSGIL
jgi:hypothetical protein